MGLSLKANSIDRIQLTGVDEGIFNECEKGHKNEFLSVTSKSITQLVESGTFINIFGRFLQENSRSDSGEVSFKIELSSHHITVIRNDGKRKKTTYKDIDVVTTAMRIYNMCSNQCHRRLFDDSSSEESSSQSGRRTFIEEDPAPQYVSSIPVGLTLFSEKSFTQQIFFTQQISLFAEFATSERTNMELREILCRNHIEGKRSFETIHRIQLALEIPRPSPLQPLENAIATQERKDLETAESPPREKITNEAETELFMIAAQEQIAVATLSAHSAQRALQINIAIQNEFKEEALAALEIQKRQIARLHLQILHYNHLKSLYQQLLLAQQNLQGAYTAKSAEVQAHLKGSPALLDKDSQTDLKTENTELAQGGITSEHPSLDNLDLVGDPLDGLAQSSASLDPKRKINFMLPSRGLPSETNYLEMVLAQMLLLTTPAFEEEEYKFTCNSSVYVYKNNGKFITSNSLPTQMFTGLFPKANKCIASLSRSYEGVSKSLHIRREGASLKTLPAYLQQVYVTSFSPENIEKTRKQIAALVKFQKGTPSQEEINSFLTDNIYPLFQGNRAKTILNIELAFLKTKNPTEDLRNLHSAAQKLKAVLKQVLACMKFTEEEKPRRRSHSQRA